MSRYATGYRFRALSPEQDAAICKARASGAPVKALAAKYGVSVRCIYRSIERSRRPVITVVIGPYAAQFQLEDGYPMRITPWVPS